MRHYIPKDEMVIGAKYRCHGRNLGEGTWNGKGLDYIRSKFGHEFPDVEYHWDDGPPHGTCKPIERLDDNNNANNNEDDQAS